MKAQLEKIVSSPRSSFKVFLYSNTEFDAPWHFHPEFELTYITKSSGMRYVGDSVLEFEEGDLILLGANLPHCWKNTTEHKTTSESIVLQWKEDVIGEGWLSRTEFMDIKKLLILASRGVKFGKAVTKKIDPLLRGMISHSPFENIISLLQILNLLAHSKNKTVLSGDNFSPRLNDKVNVRINVIHDFVNKNYHRQITLTEIAGLVSMSEESFCRFFKKTFNKSFFTFLNEYKIKLACKLLIDSNKQVAEIAFLSGYESLPFFYRQFNKFIKCTPLVYQQKYARAFVS
ncbi:AraC family transcriptional regulator [uncultured Maribacter sp.]|uniref:AraC family transcriptional regulator n=1 Tax=uncultured Maribacter sp. TaxID=431308 RepID=UPI00260FC43E|nr:AraC family transcriptional regulator [uncultured Maribacter sp.]